MLSDTTMQSNAPPVNNPLNAIGRVLTAPIRDRPQTQVDALRQQTQIDALRPQIIPSMFSDGAVAAGLRKSPIPAINYGKTPIATNGLSLGFLEFYKSNSLIAKIVYFIFVIIAFIILFKLGLWLLAKLFMPSDSPHLIDGMVDATQMLTFSQNSNEISAIPIQRSNNANDGIEFTWSIWIHINSLTNVNDGMYKHIFSKGNNDIGSDGLVQPNNAPGLYIAPNTNALVILMNTYTNINEEIIVPDIPLNKWVNVVIRTENTELDVYVNGIISRSLTLSGIPKQNNGDVYVAMNGGFNGYISNLWYYNYGLSAPAISAITASGPNTKFVNGIDPAQATDYNYLSNRWFYGQNLIN